MCLAARQKLNLIGHRRRANKDLREATAHRNDRRKIATPLFFGLLFTGLSFQVSYQAVHSLAQQARELFPVQKEGVEVLRVDFMTHYYLTLLSKNDSREEYREAIRKSNLEGLRENLGEVLGLTEEEAQQEADHLLSHLEQNGMNGFAHKSTASPFEFVELTKLSSEAQHWFIRIIALLILSLCIALTFMPLSSRTKDLGSVDSHLAWLYCLPLSAQEILSGRFLSMIFVRPLTWIILWPFLSMLFWPMGLGPWALLISLVLTFSLSCCFSGIELLVETWLRTTATFKVKKNVQALASICGTLCFYVGMAGAVSGARSYGWMLWLIEHPPFSLLAPGVGHFLLFPIQGQSGVGALLATAGGLALILGIGGWLLAARSLSQGFSSGNEREGTRSLASARTAYRSLTKFEWLLLFRDRNLAAMVLIVPLMLLFYQFLINPDLLSVTSSRQLAVIGFGCGAWAAAMTAPHVLGSEGKSMWMIFSLPVEIANYFERRARVWRITGVCMAFAVCTGLILWQGFPNDEVWRLPAAFVGVWVISLAIYAIVIGDPKLGDPNSTERAHTSVGRMYACMIVGAIVGSLLWHGTPWQVLATLILWWFFGAGLWQGVTSRLRHLLEPTEDPARVLTLGHALLALLIFFVAQVVAGAILFSFLPDDLETATLISFVIAGLIALLYTRQRLLSYRYPSPADPARFNLAAAFPLLTLGCIALAWSWLQCLKAVPFLHEAVLEHQNQAGDLGLPNTDDWRIIVLAVLAAPLIEEALFRGFIFRIMKSIWSPKGAIFASALLFAIVHPSVSFPPVFALGLSCAWLYHRTHRLWPCIALHALYNAAVVAMSQAS